MDSEFLGPDDDSQTIFTRNGLWQRPHVCASGRDRRADGRPASADAGNAGEMQAGGRGSNQQSVMWVEDNVFCQISSSSLPLALAMERQRLQAILKK